MNEIEINNKIQEVLYNSVKIRNLVIMEIPEEDIQDVANELTTLVMNNFVLDPVILSDQEKTEQYDKGFSHGYTAGSNDIMESSI